MTKIQHLNCLLAFMNAMLKNDYSTLEAVLAPGFTYKSDAAGREMTGQEAIDYIKHIMDVCSDVVDPILARVLSVDDEDPAHFAGEFCIFIGYTKLSLKCSVAFMRLNTEGLVTAIEVTDSWKFPKDVLPGTFFGIKDGKAVPLEKKATYEIEFL